METGTLPAHLVCSSPHFGELDKAGAQVRREHEPANEQTEAFALQLLKDIGIEPKGKTNTQKLVRCVCDFLAAVQVSSTGTVSWSGAAAEYNDKPYGYDIAKKVRASLEASGKIKLSQRASKRDRITRLYKIINLELPTGLSFKRHGLGPRVEVRSAKVRVEGRMVGGQKLGRRGFLPEIKALEDQVEIICSAMLQEPLTGPSGEQHVNCKRIFNNGSLEAGGRLYGAWQRYSEDERLKMTIRDEPVCEVDIKASYLSIANAKSGDGTKLEADPYQSIPFVRDAGENKAQKRQAAKLLVNAYLCKDGELSQFPKGRKDKKTKKTIPFRKEYGLTENVTYYMEQIHQTFPFLKMSKEDGYSLMFIESEIVSKTILKLIDGGIVSYPVHDCLLVKLRHKERAVAALQEAMAEVLDYIPSLDVTYLDESGFKKVEVILGTPRSDYTYKTTKNSQLDIIPYWGDKTDLTTTMIIPSTTTLHTDYLV